MANERTYDKLTPNREYKSRIFEMVFSEKEALLELYNAANGTNYDDPDLLEINTLKNAIYLGMRNDISFIIDSSLTLYEHQSTYSPNFPLRCLLYVSDLYSAITKDLNLYGKKQIKIPTPHFIVFYNGVDELPDTKEMNLSDAFIVREEEIYLELRLTLININPGYNEKLKGACKTLSDYTKYTARVRNYAKEMKIEEAVERAVTECIQEGILSEFLSKNRAEAIKVSIYEYDFEKHMKQEREENWNAGHEAGVKDLLVTQVRKKLEKGKSIELIANELEEEESVIYGICEELGKRNKY
ncbi:MAG: hypothetical protein ACI4S2_08360 [Lachnospiraceae bacterium]